jgi:hypothetical protein
MYSKSTRIAFIFFLLVIPQYLWCQTVEWSNQQKLKSKTNYTRILGENASGYYLMRSKNADLSREILIEKYKTNLALEQTTDLDQPYNSFIEKIIVQDDGLWVFATKRNDSLPKIDVLYWKLNNQLVKQTAAKILVQIDAALFKSNGLVYIESSIDKNSHCLFYCTDGLEKNTAVLNMVGFDSKATINYQRTFSVPAEAEYLNTTRLMCDNSGNAYVLINYPLANNRKNRDRDVKNHFLYAYFRQLDKTLEYDIREDSTYITALDLALNNTTNQVSVAGFYNYENNNQVAGSFMYTINIESTLMQTKSYEPFRTAFVNKVITGMLNEDVKQLSDLKIKRLIARSDGGITFIAEKVYETRQVYTYYANGFPQTASRITYNNDEIIILSNNRNGKTEFNEFIKKSQTSVSDGGYYSSFILLNTNDKLSFIYNTSSSEESDVMITSINPLGQLDTRILIKSLSYYVQLMPPESKQINNSSSLICTLKDRRFTLMKLTY